MRSFDDPLAQSKIHYRDTTDPLIIGTKITPFSDPATPNAVTGEEGNLPSSILLLTQSSIRVQDCK
jgi:hypothetical protein